MLTTKLAARAFEDLVSAVTAGDKEAARQLVEQEPELLRSAQIATAFAFLVSEVMGGDRGQAVELVKQSPQLLRSKSIEQADKRWREREREHV